MRRKLPQRRDERYRPIRSLPSQPHLRHKLCAKASLRDNPLSTSPSVDGERTGRLAGSIGVGGGSVGTGVAAEGDRQLVARRESYIRRALDAVVPRPAQNVYRCMLPQSDLIFFSHRGGHAPVCLLFVRRIRHDPGGEWDINPWGKHGEGSVRFPNDSPGRKSSRQKP